MQPTASKLLEYIRDAAAFIEEVTHDIQLDECARNRMLRQSIERNFEIIGDAMRRLTQIDSMTAQRITGHVQITAFRNTLIHGYDLIDHIVVWNIICRMYRYYSEKWSRCWSWPKILGWKVTELIAAV